MASDDGDFGVTVATLPAPYTNYDYSHVKAHAKATPPKSARRKHGRHGHGRHNTEASSEAGTPRTVSRDPSSATTASGSTGTAGSALAGPFTECFCGERCADEFSLAQHKDQASHWRCRSDGCDETFATYKLRRKHEEPSGRKPGCQLRAGGPRAVWFCPVCDHKKLKVHVMSDARVTEASLRVHPHITSHAFCWTCETAFKDCDELERHAVAMRHRLHPAQLSLYPSAQVPTMEAVYKRGCSRGEGDSKEDDAVSKALQRWFLYEHDCKLGPLVVDPATTGFDARVAEARRSLYLRGRVTHLPYLYALAHIITKSHNGNKDGAYGYYPWRKGQVHASYSGAGAGVGAGAGAGAGSGASPPAGGDTGPAPSSESLPRDDEDIFTRSGTAPDGVVTDSESDDADSDAEGESKGRRGRGRRHGGHRKKGHKHGSGKSDEGDAVDLDEADDTLPWAPEIVGKAPGGRTAFVVRQPKKRGGRRGWGPGKLGRGNSSGASSTTSSSHRSHGSHGRHSPAAGVEEYVRCACECELAAADEAVVEKADESDPPAPQHAEDQDTTARLYQLDRGDYNGHNIAAIAVDSKSGRIIGCQWNHCHLMRSTAAHAEERLIDRLFATADMCGLDASVKYNKFLKDVVIYTSLEPCYQCAGKMIMAGVKTVVWLQKDPLINVSMLQEVAERDGKTWHTRGYAAEDLFGTAMGSFGVTLNRRYMAFKRAVKAKPGVPFFVGPTGKPGFSSSVPTFLCNDDALEVFERESRRFERITESPYVRGLVPTSRRANPATSMVVTRADGASVVEICTRFEAWDYLRAIVQYLQSPLYARGGFC